MAEGRDYPSPQGDTQASAFIGYDAGTPDDCTGVYCPPPGPVTGGLPDAGEEDIVTVENFGARGLFTSPSYLTAAPPGSALVADNLVVDKPGEYTTRRGFAALPAGLPSAAPVSAWTVYQGAVIAHAASTSTLYRYVSGTWTAFPGTYAAPSPGLDSNGNPVVGQMKFFENQQALYFTTALGVYRLEGPTETPTAACVEQALPGVATVSAAGQALSASAATAYRYVWGRRATNGRVMLGAPSGRVTISNRSEGFTFNANGSAPLVQKTGGVVTVKVSAGVAANLLVGQTVTLSGVDAADIAAFPEDAEVITSVGATSFTYAQAGADFTATDPGAISFASTATAVDIAHTIPFPDGIDETYFLQVYRADEVPLNTTPSDEMYLIHEEAVGEMAVGATSYSFVDGTPDALKGDALYTNQNAGGGAGTAHYCPPKASLEVVFGGRAIYANVELKERINVTLLGVDGTSGLKIGQGLKFIFDDGTSESYTASTVEALPSTFKLHTDGTPTQNVSNTLTSIARVISTRGGGKLYARNEAGATSIVGSLFVESRDVEEGPISVEAIGNSNVFVPALPSSVGADFIVRSGGVVSVNATIPVSIMVGQQINLTAVDPSGSADFPLGLKTVTSVFPPFTFTYAEAGPDAAVIMTDAASFRTTAADVQTDDEAAPGGWMASDTANPDSVPATIPEILGDRYKRILRMIQVGSSLFFLKEDGLYRLTGTGPENYASECVDSTIRFVAPRAAWVLNGRAYALTTQGLATWTESGTPEPAALQIEDQLRAIVETAPDVVERYAFALSHESKRRAYLWLPLSSSSTSASVVYVYNATGDAWTRWRKPAGDAFIHPTEDRLYVAPAANEFGTALPPIYERNTGTPSDYQDEAGQAITAILTWTPTVPAESNLQQQLVRVTYNFAGARPTEMDVAFQTDWVNTQLWWTLDASSSTSPGTMTTVPDQDHSRGNTHTLSIQHAQVEEPLRVLGFAAQMRFWERRIP